MMSGVDGLDSFVKRGHLSSKFYQPVAQWIKATSSHSSSKTKGKTTSLKSPTSITAARPSSRYIRPNPETQDKKRLRRMVKLRRIHLQRYISVKHNGGRWWNKWMAIYFGDITQDEIINCKKNTTSDVILHFEEVRGQTQSFQDIFIRKEQPLLKETNYLKFLFRGMYFQTGTSPQEPEEEDIYQLLIFAYKTENHENLENGNAAKPEIPQFAQPKKTSVIKVQQIERQLELRAKYQCKVELKYIASVTNPSVLYNCLLYQEQLKRHNYSHIQCEIALLSNQLQQIHEHNGQKWDTAIKQYRQERQRLAQLNQNYSQIENLQTKLACRDRLLYLKKGFMDKTEDELQQALEELELAEKRLLYSRRAGKDRLASYNDCKICFYPEVKQDNEIIFCNICRTSYHRHCYGLNSPVEEQTYICDACLWMEEKDIEQENHELRPNCKICFSRKIFPLKRIGQQFFHVTCLFFYNYAKVSSLPIALKAEAYHEIKEVNSIRKAVRCFYCLPQGECTGHCLKCSIQTCQCYFHPICGYLRGCKFNITRPEELCVDARCQQHSFGGSQEDEIRQVYIRRFFCNFQNIQPLTEAQFIPLYRRQKLEIQIERRKLQEDHASWQEYDRLRKRTKLQWVTNEPSTDFDSMTVQELLSLSRAPPLVIRNGQKDQSLEIYQEPGGDQTLEVIAIE